MTIRRIVLALLALLALSSLAAGARSQALRVRATPDVRPMAEVAISPDGKHVAWVGAPATPGPATPIAIYIAGTKGAAARRVDLGALAAPGTEHSLAWSPDGRSIAFLADAGRSRQVALFVMSSDGRNARRITRVTGFLATPRWSADGKRVAFLFIDHASRAAGPVQAASRDTGVIGRHVEIQRIAIVDVATGKVGVLSPAGLYVHEYAWSPDGRRFAATANNGAGDTGWYTAQLFVIDATSGDTASILRPGMQIASPRWSPDGAKVAFIGGLMSDEGIPSGDVYVMAPGDGAARDMTPGLRASANWLAWPAVGGRILFTTYDHGGTGVQSFDPSSGQVTALWRGDALIRADHDWSIGAIAIAADGATTALIRESFDAPPEVWTGAVGTWTQLTHANRDAERRWGEARSLTWKSDEFDVQGWLIAPRHVEAKRQYPMVMVVHGGPAYASTSRWLGPPDVARTLSDSGYFVFLPNPRGSAGQGEAFERANAKDLGYGDLRDILRGVDATIVGYAVDSAALGIYGWSYGGYMTMWTVTQTGRFKAAVAGAGIANWQSYWAQNGINDWLIGYFGRSIYDDPQIYARSAPITFIKKATTPTLIIVGERDIECPSPQSYEFWRGLQAANVRTELVVYAGEGHSFSNPDHIRDRMERTVAWFGGILKSRPSSLVP